MLKRHPANKTCYVDGMCASISSVIAMACNKIVAPKTSLMLVHKPLIAGYVVGNAIDLRVVAEELDKIETVIVEAYTAKTGLTAEKNTRSYGKRRLYDRRGGCKFRLRRCLG